jgi:phytoene synthase
LFAGATRLVRPLHPDRGRRRRGRARASGERQEQEESKLRAHTIAETGRPAVRLPAALRRTTLLIEIRMSDALKEAYRHCEKVVGENAKNFKYAFVFLPREKKRAITALYAFCRLCDDISDSSGPLDEKRRELGEVRARLDKALQGKADGPVWIALADTLARFPVPRGTLEYIIQGVEQDLTVTRYEVFGELREYCFRVASAVGLACLEILGYSDRAALDCGRDLGIAMQLTNILRDVREDAERGRIYIPQEDLKRFGYSEDRLRRGVVDEDFAELMQFESARARDYFERARPLRHYLTRRCRPFVAVLSAVYEELLQKIEDSGFAVFDGRIRVSTPRKVWLMLSTTASALVLG